MEYARKLDGRGDLEWVLFNVSNIYICHHFVKQTFEPLPTHQKVAELPEINWKGYIDSLQKVAKQRSTIYMHTRKQATKPHESWKLVSFLERGEWREGGEEMEEARYRNRGDWRGRERRVQEGGNLVRECVLSVHIQGFNKTKEPAKEVEKPPTYRQPWTPEEQVKPTYQLASLLSQVPLVAGSV